MYNLIAHDVLIHISLDEHPITIKSALLDTYHFYILNVFVLKMLVLTILKKKTSSNFLEKYRMSLLTCSDYFMVQSYTISLPLLTCLYKGAWSWMIGCHDIFYCGQVVYMKFSKKHVSWTWICIYVDLMQCGLIFSSWSTDSFLVERVHLMHVWKQRVMFYKKLKSWENVCILKELHSSSVCISLDHLECKIFNPLNGEEILLFIEFFYGFRRLRLGLAWSMAISHAPIIGSCAWVTGLLAKLSLFGAQPTF